MKIYQVKVLAFAYEDIDRGKSFYNNQSENLGIYFADSILTDIESLSFYGGVHAKSFGFYRLLAKRFPYAIYYDIEDDTAVVYAVLDLRANPITNIKKLKSRF